MVTEDVSAWLAQVELTNDPAQLEVIIRSAIDRYNKLQYITCTHSSAEQISPSHQIISWSRSGTHRMYGRVVRLHADFTLGEEDSVPTLYAWR